ncbi:hypothetical protein [Vibrio sp. SCSIO 43137]|uniref:hypothetical protein n=1 Tax=Vibrio sp. SCSIO 43137 TaxID=3021011 RepID=UPI00230761E2|nr:hypothetical protein [Vibrio sp. SCSIO 43137]WCE28421.1 hypothetical protein PK654_08520 [Vibrio sp. SCSIO 43137]
MFLKLFAGEVLTTFKADNLALGLTRVRTIKNGKSASFPMIGRNGAKYHTPGTLIEGNKIAHAERVVTIDDVAVSPVFIADIDEAMNHYDFRSQYSTEGGVALAELVDRNIFRMVAKAAYLTNATKAGAAGLTVLEGEEFTKNISIAKADGAHIVASIFKARTLFKKANIKQMPICVLPPEHYETLINVQDTTKVTWMNKDVGGSGSTSEGSIARVAGISLVESNHLPMQDETLKLKGDPEPLADVAVGSGNQAKYRVQGEGLVALIFTPDCVATTKLMDVQTRSVDEPLRLGTTILSKLCVGHDILRPSCAVAVVLTGSKAATAANDVEVIDLAA